MKKTCLLLFFVTALSYGANAQQKKHEISLGIGTISSTQVTSILSNVMIIPFTLGTFNTSNRCIPTLSLEYQYAVAKKITVGGIFSYDHIFKKAYIKNRVLGNFTENFYTIAAKVGFIYINREKFQFYGLLGAGATFFTLKSQQNLEDGSIYRNSSYTVLFNCQITPLGFKFGKKIGAFFELGYGCKGIVSAGLFTRF